MSIKFINGIGKENEGSGVVLQQAFCVTCTLGGNPSLLGALEPPQRETLVHIGSSRVPRSQGFGWHMGVIGQAQQHDKDVHDGNGEIGIVRRREPGLFQGLPDHADTWGVHRSNGALTLRQTQTLVWKAFKRPIPMEPSSGVCFGT